MTSENFCYWLQGLFEIHGAGDQPLAPFNHKQMQMIRQHLEYVFNKPVVPAPSQFFSGFQQQQGAGSYQQQFQPPIGAIC